jgi:hypothetical protein
MARNYAQVQVAIWADGDFRALSRDAQHLYFTLVTAPTLNACGVADWRPARLAALAAGWRKDDVRSAADELRRALYVFPDDDTEEVLIRSFIRNDGILQNPKMAIAMIKTWTGLASATLRGVIVFEVQRLRKEVPEYSSWTSPMSSAALEDMLSRPAINPSALPPYDPSD